MVESPAWIKANNPDPAATVRVWAKSLERNEVESVIARWCTGKQEAPEGYQKENSTSTSAPS